MHWFAGATRIAAPADGLCIRFTLVGTGVVFDVRQTHSPATATADAASGLSKTSSTRHAATGGAPVYAGRAPDPAAAARCVDDVAHGGADWLTFAQVARLKCMCLNGKPRHVAFVHRAADPSKAHPLDFAVVSGVRCSTLPACLRWLAANSGAIPSNSATWTPGRTRREHQTAERALAADGF